MASKNPGCICQESADARRRCTFAGHAGPVLPAEAQNDDPPIHMKPEVDTKGFLLAKGFHPNPFKHQPGPNDFTILKKTYRIPPHKEGEELQPSSGAMPIMLISAPLAFAQKVLECCNENEELYYGDRT